MTAAVTHVWTQEELLREVPRGGMAARAELAPGDTIGDLKILELFDVAKSGGKRFLVRCECGDVFVRRASVILQGARRGAIPSCKACFVRLRKLNWELKGNERHQHYRRLFFNTGSLYSHDATERLRTQIFEDLEREIAPMRDTPSEEMNQRGLWVDPTWKDVDWPNADRAREDEERELSKRVRRSQIAAQLERETLHAALGKYVTPGSRGQSGSEADVAEAVERREIEKETADRERRRRAELPWSVQARWKRPCVCNGPRRFGECCGSYDPCPCGSGQLFRKCHAAAVLRKVSSAPRATKEAASVDTKKQAVTMTVQPFEKPFGDRVFLPAPVGHRLIYAQGTGLVILPTVPPDGAQYPQPLHSVSINVRGKGFVDIPVMSISFGAAPETRNRFDGGVR